MRGILGLLSVVALATTSAGVQLVNNGYEDLVVAISPSVDESNAQNIIESIKTTITEASAALFKATRQRAFFRDVKILLPKTWTNTPFDEPALNQNFENSDIRVDVRNVVYGDQPYTDQPGGCGAPGRYIHLTPEYLTDNAQAAWWGPRSKTLVHEWAKLRWGVFDEVGYPHDPSFPLFYRIKQITANGEQDILTANYCANKDLTGVLRDIVSKSDCNYVNGIPDDNCRFVPDIVQDATSSLMAYYYINSVEEFCDSGSGEAFLHNDWAPNKHNRMCNERSVWDVISLHQDFANGTITPNNTFSPTQFTVMREEEAKFVLVLDYSGSMSSYQRIEKLQRTARRWILHEVAQGSFVGIVRFSSSAQMVANLTEITDDNSRSALANLITTDNGGGTSIGGGLLMAVDDILIGQKNPVILLISDGGENQRPLISDVKDKVINSGSRVVTVAFGNAADEKLESLAEETGGKTFTVIDEDDGQMLDDAFLGALTYQPGETLNNTNIEIYEFHHKDANTTLNETFFVDYSVGRDLEFRLESPDNPNHVTSPPVLVSPSGEFYDAAQFDSAISMWSISIPLAEEGEWTWTVELSGNTYYSIRVGVTAKARDPDTMPIITRAWVSASNEVNATQEPVVVYAEVRQGNRPVVGAQVKAVITQPFSSTPPVEIFLLDNGQGVDTQAGDGTYSKTITTYSTTGRYAVKAQVWDDGSAFVNNGFTTSRRNHPRALPALPLDVPTYCCGSVVPFDPDTATPTGSFTRSASGGSFRVTAVPDGDIYPPSRVTDLLVNANASANATKLILTWTATGDDYDDGRVSGYEVRLSSNRSALSGALIEGSGSDTLLLSFEDSANRTELLVDAGQKVTLEVEAGEEIEMDKVYFLALRAIDDEGSVSDVSNLAPLVISTPENPTEGGGLEGWAIALIVIACVVGIGALAGGAILAKRKGIF